MAKMISQSQEMLYDAHLHLTNFQKMKNLMRMIQMRHARSAFEKWYGFCSAEAEEMRAKWHQPAVQKFLRSILQQRGTGAFYAWREEVGGGESPSRVPRGVLPKTGVECCISGMER